MPRESLSGKPNPENSYARKKAGQDFTTRNRKNIPAGLNLRTQEEMRPTPSISQSWRDANGGADDSVRSATAAGPVIGAQHRSSVKVTRPSPEFIAGTRPPI